MQNKFKVGDKVKVKEEYLPKSLINKKIIGTIFKFREDVVNPIHVVFDNKPSGVWDYYNEHELVNSNSELIKQKLGVK